MPWSREVIIQFIKQMDVFAMDEGLIKELEGIVGPDLVKNTTAELYVYSMDAGIHRHSPDAVVRPQNNEQVQGIVKFANMHKIPIVPRGAGTALCGHSVPIDGGVIVDMQGMNKIKEIVVEDLYCVVEPGVIHADLNKALKPYNFFIPGPASGNVANIGGMVATNASGAKAVKYGATRDYVLGLEIVLPTGEIARVGSRTLKNSSGYQLEKLFTGMEGTLGIITEITLRVAPLPKKRALAIATFDDLETSGKCVSNIIAKPLIPSSLELMSHVCIEAVNKATDLNLPDVEAILLIEVDGHPAVVKEEIEIVTQICKETGALSVEFTDDEVRIVQLMKGRKSMIPALSNYREGLVTVMLADDMAVPMSQVPKAVKAFQEISDRYDIIIATYGHAGDGNLHTKVLMDPISKEHWRQAEKAVAEVYKVVGDLGGIITGEHGVAITKAPFFHKEKASAIKTMKAIKKALDPNNIMNPHKIMDWEKGFVSDLRYRLERD